MRPFKSKKADAILESKQGDLGFIFGKIKALKKIDEAVKRHLDNKLTGHCQVANLELGKLTLLTTSGAIATQLRYLSANLLRSFAKDPILKSIQSIETIVRPEQKPSSQKHHRSKPAPPSEATAKIIKEIADSISDPKLKATMKRIAEKK